LMTVRFDGAPPIEKVRTALTAALANPPSVETFENGSNEIQIGTEGGSGTERANDETLAKNRQLVLDTLAKTFGQPGNGKLDLNNTSAGQLADRMRDPLQRAGVALSDPQVNDLAAGIVGWRDQHGGLVANLNEIKAVSGVTPQVFTALGQETYLSSYTASRHIEIVGPKVGAELRSQAINATLLALAGMLMYIWFRFEWIYGVAAVIAGFYCTL